MSETRKEGKSAASVVPSWLRQHIVRRLKHQIPFLTLASIPKASDLREMLPSAVLLAYHARIMTAYPSRSPPQFSSFHMFSVQSNKRKRPNKQKINTSHVVCSYHLYQFCPDTFNSKYTCISASFLRTTVIGRMKLSISGMLGVQMHDWVHGQTNTS